VTTDPLKGFEDLEEPYPGRRKPVNRDRPTAAADDAPLWDAHPVTFAAKGVATEFFYISALAKALDYSIYSVRLWEDRGLLPNSGYRSPRAKGKTPGKGKRLWTRAQIEAIILVAKKHRVIFPDLKGVKHPPTPAFAREVAQKFNELLG